MEAVKMEALYSRQAFVRPTRTFLMTNMISDIYDAILENISCQRSPLVLCSIRIRQFNGKTTIILLGVSFSRSTCWANESALLNFICTCLTCISTTYIFSLCDFTRRLTEPLRDNVLHGTWLQECVFVSLSVYARLKFRILLSCFRVKQGSKHVWSAG